MRGDGQPLELDPRDVAACRALLLHNSRTFHAASLVLPRAVRDPASVLYGFCRLADDAVDTPDGRRDAVEHLRERLAAAYAGTPHAHPADRALAVVLARHAVPRALPEALIEGLAWDAEGRRYETLPDLLDYAARVAGTVGAMMAVLMGVQRGARSAEALARACDLGVAMQLTNICRDVAEDARMGRVYLPLAWLRDEGIAVDAWLARPVYDAALGRVVERLLAEAEALYARAGAGIALLPAGCRPGIQAARRLYRAIGRSVAREMHRAGGHAVAHRAIVPGWRKAALLAAAPLPARGRVPSAPPLAATRGLVDAAAIADPRRATGYAFVLDLWERLERRDRYVRGNAA